nr:MACPF domain-containing protein CAD1 [Tanacetum cinerariifolium]
EDDRERARFLGGKISLERKKSLKSNIGDSGNTGDGGKTVGGAIRACGRIGDSLLVALYACMTFIYGSSWKGEIASEAKRYLDKSFEGSEKVFPGWVDVDITLKQPSGHEMEWWPRFEWSRDQVNSVWWPRAAMVTNKKSRMKCKVVEVVRLSKRGSKGCFCLAAVLLLAGMRLLWDDLGKHKLVIRDSPWILMGDFNVALNMDDTYTGSSSMSSAMCDFKDCVAKIEVVDINSLGLHYTWTQKPKGELDEVQKALDLNPSDPILREEESTYLQAFNEAKLDEKRFLKQKAKIDWLEEGDSNSAYFHKSIKCRNQRSRIEAILDSNNIQVTDCLGLFSKNVSADSASHMVRAVTNEEIKAAMFSIGDDKAPGPDGYTYAFFKKGWDVVGHDVCNAVHDFFSNGQLLKEINHTFLALIPKAYDTVYWHFLETILFHFGFPGLVPSIPKGTDYFCNVLNHVKLAILSIMPFSEGELPVKYLGVPLISSRLLNKDCKVLVEKAKNWIGDWKNKSLSFAAKVAWHDMSLPESEVGLGLRDLEVFNFALTTTHIWNIVNNKESLWVRWIHAYKLRGRTFWDIIVKNGASTSIWHDNWSSFSPLTRYLFLRDIKTKGFHMHNYVSDLISNGNWLWPQSWLTKASNLGLIPVPCIEESRPDHMESSSKNEALITTLMNSIQALGRGFDVTSDIRLLYCKGASGSPLIHLDHQHTRNLVFSDALSIPNVSAHVDFSKGQRDIEATPVSSFHEMARYFNMKSNLSGDVPLGSFNAMFNFTGSRQVDASSTKSLAMIGYVVPLYEVRLENSDLVLLQEVKRAIPYSWDPASLA